MRKTLRWLPALVLLVCVLPGCAGDPPAEERASGVALTRAQPLEITVPDQSRSAGIPLEPRIALRGGWSALSSAPGEASHRRPLPVRPRTMLTDRAPRGLRVLDASGREVPHASQAAPGQTRWEFDESSLTLHVAGQGSRPDDFFLEDVRAPGREARLNRALSSAASDLDFVRASFFHRNETRSGLLIPAPGLVRFELELPPDPRLHFAPCLVPPEIESGEKSDGVLLRVSLRDGQGGEETLWSEQVLDASCPELRLDLARWEGERVTLTLESEPGESPALDYAFFADPVVTSARHAPRRVVMIFADTLRPDHLGYSGYSRQTSPALDKLAAESLVFTNARAPAPWTLPSARALVTGRHPERFAVSTTLPVPLRDQGWATAFFGGNAFVSASYGLDRGWGLHRADQGVSASAMVDRGLEWLESHAGRDALLMLHFMDVHLPYEEPSSHRALFAGDAPAELGETFDRWDVQALGELPPSTREYIVGRYDNTIRYLDDQVARLLEALDDDDIIVFFADHGEEFWEHGGFEHGHALYDELLRVPLLFRAPGLERGSVASPVSLMDVMPTILDLLDVEAPDTWGRSLTGMAVGGRAKNATFDARALAFGWPLYGAERWGALRGSAKYLTHLGSEELFDLSSDPGETTNLLEGKGWEEGAEHRAALAEALGREVRLAFLASVQARTPRASQELDLRLSAPAGFEALWSREGYLQVPSAGVETALDEGVAYVRWKGWFQAGDPVFALPSGEFEAAWRGLQASARLAGRVGGLQLQKDPRLIDGLVRVPFSLTEFPGGLGLALSPVVTPLPVDPSEEGARYDAESEAALRSLGYSGN